MDFETLSFAFDRALSCTFSKKKLLSLFCLMALSGLLVVFCRGLALHADPWVRLSLTFLPLFIGAALLLPAGVLLIRLYHDEVKHKGQNYRHLLSHSWPILMGTAYFALPILAAYLFLWLLLGVFVLLSEIPILGAFFDLFFSFAPFLINLAILGLGLASIALLFFAAPVMALRGMEGPSIVHTAFKRLERDPLANCILALIALAPLALTLLWVLFAAFLTGLMGFGGGNAMQDTIGWFFIMLPFTACLTPAVVFFFNFAVEAHILMQKQVKGS